MIFNKINRIKKERISRINKRKCYFEK